MTELIFHSLFRLTALFLAALALLFFLRRCEPSWRMALLRGVFIGGSLLLLTSLFNIECEIPGWKPGALLWFHPLAWWLAERHLVSCEEARDAAAARLGGVESYRRSVAQVALGLLPAPSPSLFRRNGRLVDRLNRVQNSTRNFPRISASPFPTTPDFRNRSTRSPSMDHGSSSECKPPTPTTPGAAIRTLCVTTCAETGAMGASRVR